MLNPDSEDAPNLSVSNDRNASWLPASQEMPYPVHLQSQHTSNSPEEIGPTEQNQFPQRPLCRNGSSLSSGEEDEHTSNSLERPPRPLCQDGSSLSSYEADETVSAQDSTVATLDSYAPTYDDTSSSSESEHGNNVLARLPEQLAVQSPQVLVENSTDVHVGPHFQYNGPITVKQYISLDGKKAIENDSTTSPLPAQMPHLKGIANVLLKPGGKQGIDNDAFDPGSPHLNNGISAINISEGNGPVDRIVACYVCEWASLRTGLGKFTVDDVDPTQCTHLLYAFANFNEDTNSIESKNPSYDLGEDNQPGNIILMVLTYIGSFQLNQRMVNQQIKKILQFFLNIITLLRAGAPPSKLVLGVQLYGRNFLLKNEYDGKGFGDPADGNFFGPYVQEAGTYGYNEICHALGEKNSLWKTYWDNVTHTPFMVQNKKFMSYDNERSLTDKLELAREENLAGVSVYALDTDDFQGNCAFEKTGVSNYPLMRLINRALAFGPTKRCEVETFPRGKSRNTEITP
ncbi:hypothetical protein C0J52_15586 [Blattella germanica]|nr:hypothetical protein C0J52_15586 [Blattella germanica]